MTFDSFPHTSNKFCTTDTISNVKCVKRESFSVSTMQHHSITYTPPSTTKMYIYYTKDFKNKQRSLREPPDLCPKQSCSNDQQITKITPTSTYLCILATTQVPVLQYIEFAERTDGIYIQPLVYAGAMKIMAARKFTQLSPIII